MLKKSHILMVMTAVAVLLFTNAYAREELIHSDGIGEFPQALCTDFVSLMSEEDDKALEHLLINAWENMETTIDVSPFNMTIEEYESKQSRYKVILESNPVYTIYTDGSSKAKSMDGIHISKIYPQYRTEDTNKLQELKQSIDNASEEILYNIRHSMSDFDKIMTVHDYMALNYSYDTTLENHSISIMTTKTGVCQAYAYAFKHIMNILDIECQYVTSEAMNHMWNLVKVDGNWFNIDITQDDPLVDKFGQVRHTYALLSATGIATVKNANGQYTHYGFSSNAYAATSTIYDNADWRDGIGSIVHCNGTTYWWDDNDLTDSNDNEIVDDISNNNTWNIGLGRVNGIYPGLATYNDKLYYNSDKAIYCYDPVTKTTKTLITKTGICGLYINNNTLYYSTAYVYTVNNRQYVGFEKGGEIELGEFSTGGSYRKDKDTVVTRICNTSDKPVTVFLFDGKQTKSQMCKTGISKIEMDTDASAYVFVWDDNLKPLTQKNKID